MKKSLAIVITLALLLITTVPALAVVPTALQGGGIAGLSTTPAVGDTKMIIDCESTTGLSLWPGGSNVKTPSLSTDAKVGVGSMKVPSGGTIQKFFAEPVSVDDTYYLSIWVKTAGKTSGSLPMIRIYTGGTTANCLQYWPSDSIVLGAGIWTQMMTPLTAKTDAAYVGVVVQGIVDLSNITGIQIDGRAEGDLYIDDVKFVKANAIQDSDWNMALPTGNKVSVDNANDNKGLVFHKTPQGSVYTASAMAGKLNGFTTDGLGSYKVLIPVGDINLQSIWGTNFPAIELSNAKKQFLSLDLYLPDKGIISTDTTKSWNGKLTVAIAYSVGGNFNDTDAMRWMIDPTQLNNGWNRLILPLNYTTAAIQDLGYCSVEKMGIGPNKEGSFAVNQYRIAFNSTIASADLYLDNMNIIYTEGVAPTDITVAPTITNVTGASLKLNWSKALSTANGSVGGYIISREKNDVLFGGWVADGNIIKINGSDVTTYTDTGLDLGTEYRYTIKAVEDINTDIYNYIAIYKVSNSATTLKVAISNEPNSNTGDYNLILISIIFAFSLCSLIFTLKRKKI